MKTAKWPAGRESLFWVLHIGGWSAWGIFGKYLYTVLTIEQSIPGYALYVALITLIGIVISLGLRYLYRRSRGRPLWSQALALGGGSAVAGYLWISARQFIFGRWFESDSHLDAWMAELGPARELYEKISFHDSYLSSALLMMIWSALYFTIIYYREYREIRESALKSAAMAHEAQLKMLRYQLNPHFLFNTLNAISTLILEKQNETANRMVGKLSSFLRYSLDNDPMQRITLRQEIAALMLYLDIEKVRFEDRLCVEIDVSERAQGALIPSLLLQPLVENAIKYGIAQLEEGGRLRIAASVFGDELLLELSDNGPGMELAAGEPRNGRGVGVRNTRERLRELYGERHGFRLRRTEPHGLTVDIRIPFEQERNG